MWCTSKYFPVLVSLVLSIPIVARGAESIRARHIQVAWLAPKQFAAGKTTIGIRYVLDPEWHIYWKNPGDSGTAPKFKFTSQSADVGSAMWPAPKRLPIGDFVNLGYEGTTVLPFEVSPHAGENKIGLEAKLEWLVCNKGECIPGFGSLLLERPLGAKEIWADRDRDEVQAALARVPQDSTKSSWSVPSVQASGENMTVFVSGAGNIESLDLFSTDGAAIRPQSPVKRKTSSGASFTLQRQPGAAPLGSMSFVVTDGERSWEWTGVKVTSSAQVAASVDFVSLLILLLSSFVGGVILNFMPCVLPVLSIKFLSISQTPSSQRIREALLYTAGVLVTFALLGGIFLMLRSAGASIGWGFQLQSPPVVLSLAVLFWLMALNFLGVFEFGTKVMNIAGKSASTGAFATGVLSVFVAAPCTGPFMGTALGAAATLPAFESLAIFICLGLGLASPFLLVAVSPRARAWIPRPGAWMETLKQFFAFPLIATVIWLLWVLHLQVGVDALPLSLGMLLLLSFAFWWNKTFRKGALFFLILSILSLIYIGRDFDKRATDSMSSATSGASLWAPFSPEKVEAARAQGRPVLIDFTAAWCITCQFNKKAVLRIEPIRKLFQERNVALFEADWTKQDPIITEALAKFGRNSVPLYVFYPSHKSEAKILPQILTPSMIEGLFP